MARIRVRPEDRQGRGVPVRRVLTGVAAMSLAWLGQLALVADRAGAGICLYAIAVVMFVAAFGGIALARESLIRPLARKARPLSMPTRVAGLACILAAGSLVHLSLRMFLTAEPNAPAAWWAHAGSVLLGLLAVIFFDPPEWTLPARVCSVRERRRRLAIALGLIGILMLAAFMRLYRFGDLPHGIWFDEAEHGLQAQRILASSVYRPIFEPTTNGPAHYSYLVAAMFQLFGDSVQSIRAVNVLFGLLTVYAGYLAGRELFGRTTGLVLAYLLAVSSWLVTLNRIGMFSASSTPLFSLLSIAFLLRAMRTGRFLDYGLTGLWIGLGLCFYTSFRLFLPVILVFVVHSLIVSRRRLGHPRPSRIAVGLNVTIAIAAVATAPLVLYAYAHPDIYWARVQQTFIFSDPHLVDRWGVLLDNIRKHVLMFHWRGDPNGRHNLPGAPMLDSWMAGAMALGLAYSVRRMLSPPHLLLITWLGFTLLGGVLSLHFEAPQSHRSNGALPAAYLLAVIPLAVFQTVCQTRTMRRWRLPLGVLLAGILALVAVGNYRAYFVAQANDFAVWNAFSTPETIAARLIRELDPRVDAYVSAYFDNHPSLRYVGVERSRYEVLPTTVQLPLDLTADREVLIVLRGDESALFNKARRYYPNAEFAEIGPPMPGPPVVLTIRLTPADIASIQGLTTRYYAGRGWRGAPIRTGRDPVLDFDWTQQTPVPLPFSAEWEGVLRVPDFGQVHFFLQALGRAELTIDQQAVSSGKGIVTESILLPAGLHPIRVRTEGAKGIVVLRWGFDDAQPETIPATALYTRPVTANGLLGRYYPNDAWRPPERLARIDERLDVYFHRPVLPRPYTVEWTGRIAIPVTGRYAFGLESIDESWLWIDDGPVIASARRDEPGESHLDLTEGFHTIRLRLADRTDHTFIKLSWSPPGSAHQIVPDHVLFPTEVAAVSSIRSSAMRFGGGWQPNSAAIGKLPTSLPVTQVLGRPEILVSGLDQPRGIGVDRDGLIWVAVAGAGKVKVFAPDGTEIGVFPPDAARLNDPADVACNWVASGCHVLDAGNGELVHLLPRTGIDARVPADRALIKRARGLAVDRTGHLWLANTSRGNALRFDSSGSRLEEVIGVSEGDAQPTDIVVAFSDKIFVTDPLNKLLVRIDPTGQRELVRAIAAANTLDGPHLAWDGDESLYLTEPETGCVLRLDADGKIVWQWDLTTDFGQPVKPVGVAVGPDGRIWVTDVAGGRLIAISSP